MPSKLVIVLIGGLLISACMGWAFMAGRLHQKALYVEQDKRDLEAALAHRDALQAQIDAMAGENAGLIHQLRNVKLEANKHATPAQKSATCNLTLGAVGVLNVRKGYPLGTAENPGLPAGKDAAASTVTGERVLTELESCENDYQLAITRLNGLIDSVQVTQ